MLESFRDFNHNMKVSANDADTSNWNGATPTQKELIAGEYTKGHITFNGLSIMIENPAGSVRSGDDWTITLFNHYGYIENTLGADGDEIDIYVGEVQHDKQVTFIDQYIDGEYDETKIMIGFPDELTAVANYMQNFDAEWSIDDHIVNSVPFYVLFDWLNKSDTTKPFTNKQGK